MLYIRKTTIALLAAITAACTQQPAQIVMKGQEVFGKNGVVANNSYTGPISNTTPVQSYTTAETAPIAPFHAASDTVPNASVGSIGVNDLPPPSKDSKTAPFAVANKSDVVLKAAEASDLAPAAGSTTIPPAASAKPLTNPWTNKPRDSELVANENPTPSKADSGAVAKLDAIVGQEGDKKISANTPPKTQAAFLWPVKSTKIISSFGAKGKGKANDGISIASANGDTVRAAAGGEVIYVGDALGSYGNMVVIKHSDNKSTSYAHLQKASVEKYDRVKQGDIIGYVGKSGSVSSPQLHFSVRNGKEAVDPLKYLNSNVASLQ